MTWQQRVDSPPLSFPGLGLQTKQSQSGAHPSYKAILCFYFIIYKCMPAPILHRDVWPTVGHLVHTIYTHKRGLSW